MRCKTLVYIILGQFLIGRLSEIQNSFTAQANFMKRTQSRRLFLSRIEVVLIMMTGSILLKERWHGSATRIVNPRNAKYYYIFRTCTLCMYALRSGIL